MVMIPFSVLGMKLQPDKSVGLCSGSLKSPRELLRADRLKEVYGI